MTRSGCASGAHDGSNNLHAAYVDRFAHYLAEVVAHFRTDWDLTFQTIEPFNEPSISNWRRFHNQDGCHTSRTQQRAAIARLRGKGLWMTEFGTGGGPHDHHALGPALRLAAHIRGSGGVARVAAPEPTPL